MSTNGLDIKTLLPCAWLSEAIESILLVMITPGHIQFVLDHPASLKAPAESDKSGRTVDFVRVLH
jgi:hypothetical protein